MWKRLVNQSLWSRASKAMLGVGALVGTTYALYTPKLISASAEAPAGAEAVGKFKMDEDEFVRVLDSLMQHCEKLQNNPPDLIPQEELPANEIVEFLKPYTYPNGPLLVKKFTYVPGRSNLVIEYPGETDQCVCCAFILFMPLGLFHLLALILMLLLQIQRNGSSILSNLGEKEISLLGVVSLIVWDMLL
jgi:hypothetical protein